MEAADHLVLVDPANLGSPSYLSGYPHTFAQSLQISINNYTIITHNIIHTINIYS